MNITTPDCDTVSDQQIVFFGYTITLPSNQWDEFATSYNQCQDSAAWDDQWYYGTLTPNVAKYYFAGWHNLTANEHGFVAIWNSNGHFWIYRNGHIDSPVEVPGGNQVSTTWHTQGIRIVLSVRNPTDGVTWDVNNFGIKFSH